MQNDIVSFQSKRIALAFVLMLACNLSINAQSQVAPNAKDNTPTQENTPDQKKPDTSSKGGIEILSDTMGVDFTPYMKKLRYTVQAHWDLLIPESARPPISKSGMVVIEFAINKDGKVYGMKLVKSSDDSKLDTATWGAITDAIPLPTLPTAFKGDYLRMRCSFSYNPAASAEIRPFPRIPSQQKPQSAIVTNGAVEYISDHKGLDETYTKLVLGKVQASLQNLLQKGPPGSLKTSSQVAITFSILRNGAAKAIKLKKSSGDKAFDLAVWEAIQSSSPYQDLPQQFKGKLLKVRCDIGIP